MIKGLSKLSNDILCGEIIKPKIPKSLIGISVNNFKYVSTQRRVYSASQDLKKRLHLDIYDLHLLLIDEISYDTFVEMYHPLDTYLE